MNAISRKLGLWCLRNEGIAESQYPIVIYGIELFLNTTLKVVGILTAGAVLGMFFVMALVCLGTALVSKINFEGAVIVQFLMICHSAWMIFRYAPRNSEKNPITDEKILRRKRKGSFIWLACNVIIMSFCKADIRWLIILPVFAETMLLSSMFYKMKI